MRDMQPTLLLNATYEPLQVVDWKLAVTLVYQGKADLIEGYDQILHGPSRTMPAPAVIRLVKMVKYRTKPHVKFNRANLYARDRHMCLYCGEVHKPSRLTFDHIQPASRGGKKHWSNIATACVPCNAQKADRTPQEAGMRLMKVPGQPQWLPLGVRLEDYPDAPEQWKPYFFQRHRVVQT